MKFLAAESLQISLEFNISAWAWVLYVGNHSRPDTTLYNFFFVVVAVVVAF